MSSIERLTVTMPSEMAAILHQSVDAGEYASASEVVREALRDWSRARDQDRRDLDSLRAAIQAGIDSGPGIPADVVYARLDAIIAERRKASE